MSDSVQVTAVAVVAGASAGIVVALVLSRFLSGLLFGVSPADPLSFFVAASALAAVAAVAAYLPVRRALTISPSAALRQ